LHVSDKIVLTHLVGIAIGGLANKRTKSILAFIPNDLSTLSLFKTQLSQIKADFPSVVYILGHEISLCAGIMQKKNIESVIKMTEELDDSASFIRQADEAFFARYRTYWFNAMAKVIDTLEANLPYAETCERLAVLHDQLDADIEDNPDALLTGVFYPMAGKLYQLTIKRQTYLHAVLAAIEVFISKAKSSQLPDTLPVDAPKDLFSDKPFVYNHTTNGFILRCQAPEEPGNDDIHEYQFKVRK